ncbi:MAG: ACT domain-containing protein [Candidatus Methylacidiphilales bacterium]|nr:ACT domain-containing protein [Candidatus Methylacidiphilales bacterium]
MSAPVSVATQLALFLANKPGTFAAVCRALSRAAINIYAITTSDTIDHSVVRMIVDQPRAALRVLEQHGCLVLESDVLMIEGNNKPGSLADITQRLADEGINIEYAYCATEPKASRGLLILRPSNVPKALKALNTPATKARPATAEKKPAAAPKKPAKAKSASSSDPTK